MTLVGVGSGEGAAGLQGAKGHVGVRNAKGTTPQDLTESPLQLVSPLEEGYVQGGGLAERGTPVFTAL